MCRMNTNFWACCFKAPERAPGKQLVSGFQLDEETEADICSGVFPSSFTSSAVPSLKKSHPGRQQGIRNPPQARACRRHCAGTSSQAASEAAADPCISSVT